MEGRRHEELEEKAQMTFVNENNFGGGELRINLLWSSKSKKFLPSILQAKPYLLFLTENQIMTLKPTQVA